MDGDPRPGRGPAAGPGRAADRLGQVSGLLHRYRHAARPGRGPVGHRLPAARPHAQPDRRGRPGRHPGPHRELGQHRRVGAGVRRGVGGRGRRAAGQPGTAEQPGLPRPGAAQADRGSGDAGRGRGALHLRLGPRFPARLPAAGYPVERAAARRAGAGHDRDRERPGDPGRRRAARRRTRAGNPGAARPAGPPQPAPGGRRAAASPAAPRLARRAPG